MVPRVPRRRPVKKARVTKSTKGGLQFPVGRVSRKLRTYTRCRRVSAASGVYLAAVLEYLAVELVEISGDNASAGKRKRISPRDLMVAMRDDEEMQYFTRNAIISQGGVVPYIHRALLPRKLAKATAAQ